MTGEVDIARLADIGKVICGRSGCGGIVIGPTGLCDPCFTEWLRLDDETEAQRLARFKATPKDKE